MRFSHQTWRRRQRQPGTHAVSVGSLYALLASGEQFPERDLVKRYFEQRHERIEQYHAKEVERNARRRAAIRGVESEKVDRLAIIERDERRCYLCGRENLKNHEIHLDHVVPIARGGSHTAQNLRVACAPCNMTKGASMPSEEAGTIQSARPNRQARTTP